VLAFFRVKIFYKPEGFTMARVRAEQGKLTLVDAWQFLQCLKVLAKIATPSKMPVLNRTALLEVSQKLQKVIMTTTALEEGAQLELPCVCYRDERAVVNLDSKMVTALERHAELVGDPESGTGVLTFESTNTPEKARFGGIAFGVEDVDIDAWPDAWTFAGMGKESRSDALVVTHAELLEAIRFALPSRCPDEARIALQNLHLRRVGQNGSAGWRMEATDGHRAAIILRRGTMARDLLMHHRVTRAYQHLAPLVDEVTERISVQTFNSDVEARKAGSLLVYARMKLGGAMQLISRASGFGWKHDGTISDFPPIDNVMPSKKDCLEFTGEVEMLKRAAQAVVDLSRVVKRKKDDAFPAEHSAFIMEDASDRTVYLYHEPSRKRWPLAASYSCLGKWDQEKPCRVAFNPHYLLGVADAFKQSKRFTAWVDPKVLEPLLLEDELDGRALIMPMRM
jgi:hypothetical protein